MDNKLKSFSRILEVLDTLRAECPWDKKQTLQSLRPLTIEETYELSEAIVKEDFTEIKKEIGDVFLHLIFYAKIAEEKGKFNIADVLNSECDKLIYRHPHIYGEKKDLSEEEVKQNWEKLKLNKESKSLFEGVPSSLPSLVKASRIQEKARGVGFDWDNKKDVWNKVLEELNELSQEVEINNQQKIEEEFGDLMFAMVNYARFINVNPDTALEKANKKFIERFELMEKIAKEKNELLYNQPLEVMDKFWVEAKNIIKKREN